MRKVTASELQEIGTRLFDAAGSPHEESQLVSNITSTIQFDGT